MAGSSGAAPNSPPVLCQAQGLTPRCSRSVSIVSEQYFPNKGNPSTLR